VTVVLVVAVAILSVAVVLMAAGLVEVYAELTQVRTVLRLQDQPSIIQLSTLGHEFAELMPDPPPGLDVDTTGESHVLVLSNTCSVCSTIGTDLAETRPSWAEGLIVLVAADTERAGREFLAELGLTGPRRLVDELGTYARQLGIDNSPTVLKILDGRLENAANLTSVRQLRVFMSPRSDPAISGVS